MQKTTEFLLTEKYHYNGANLNLKIFLVTIVCIFCCIFPLNLTEASVVTPLQADETHQIEIHGKDLMTGELSHFSNHRSSLQETYTLLMDRVAEFVRESINNNWISYFDRTKKIYSGTTLNEEIGLTVVLYRYEIPKYSNLGHLIVVSSDRLNRKNPLNIFDIRSKAIISFDLQEHASSRQDDYNYQSKYIIGSASGVTIDIPEILKSRVINIALPYFQKGIGNRKLIYTLNIKNDNGIIKIKGNGTGDLTIEDKSSGYQPF